jgi:chromosome segregation ATPase
MSAPTVRVSGALALLTSEAASNVRQLERTEAERDALEVALNDALARASTASASALQSSTALRLAEQQRADAEASVAALQSELALEKAKSAGLEQQNGILVQRLQSVLHDSVAVEDGRRDGAAEVSRLSCVLEEAQGEIKRLFEECAKQRERADKATSTLTASLADEKDRCAALAAAVAKKEVSPCSYAG